MADMTRPRIGDGIPIVTTRSSDPNVAKSNPIASCNFVVMRTLGEGAFGEVKLVVDTNNPETAVAMKTINLLKHNSAVVTDSARKEALILKYLTQSTGRRHRNILAYIGMRLVEKYELQIFMEYVDGGELFDRIEPDVGMPVKQVKKFFRQLLSGLEFMHGLGVAHRDIKPENLLLTKSDVLKISDFGMATMFRVKGVERLLEMSCGTAPYASPDVLRKKYNSCPEYVGWRESSSLDKSPWKKISTQALCESSLIVSYVSALLRIILNDSEDTRATITRINEHPWMKRLDDSRPPAKKRKFARQLQEDTVAATQQPAPSVCSSSPVAVNTSFSQPLETWLISQIDSQFPTSQPLDPLQRLVKRMTRLCVKLSLHDALDRLVKECEAEGWTTWAKTKDQVCHLSQSFFKVLVQCPQSDMSFVVSGYVLKDYNESKVMLDFRRSKGDGLAFKRVFLALKQRLGDVVCSEGADFLVSQGLLLVHSSNSASDEDMSDD